MIPAIAEALADIAPVLYEALTKGVTKETLIDSIKKLMTDASDAEMHREFPQG